MTKIINVKKRQDFDDMLHLVATAEVKVVDTETNGLKMYAGAHLISLSLYFPDADVAYNIAFAHGEGEVELSWTNKFPEGTDFFQISWQGKLKKQLYLKYWFNHFKREVVGTDENYFQNCPVEWLSEIQAVWGKGVHILHNSRFDAHVLYTAGFPDMEMVYDTMVGLHLVFEDWRHVQFTAPYTYTAKDAPTKDDVGLWAKDENGKLFKKLQWGNRQLKWQAARIGIPNATDGETALFAARRQFESVLVDHIMENILDEMNEELLLASVIRGKAKVEDWEKQREKIAAKVQLDDKANMWMLPADYTAYYAGLDVVLTWHLYQYVLKGIAENNVEELWEQQSLIHHNVAWEMERNGFKLDAGQANAQIEALTPKIEDLEDLLSRLAMEYGVEGFNPNSPTTLLTFLNSGILATEFHASIFPDWWDSDLATGLKTYDKARVSYGELSESEDYLDGTNKAELEKVGDHAVVRMIKELRKMHKARSTYLSKWLDAADDKSIVRFSIDDTGTIAGRASSSGDAGNGQNIPDRGGYTIKKAVTSYGDDWRLGAIDFGQLELRLGAWVAETLLGFDPNMTMTNLFLSGEDMHSYVRDMINVRDILFGDMTDDQIVVKLGYSLNQDKVKTKEKRAAVVAGFCRQAAKTMNFGLLYSGGARMLSKLLKIEEAPAKVLVAKWRDLFPAFGRTQEYMTSLALTRRLMDDTWETQYPINPGSTYNFPNPFVTFQEVYGMATAEELEDMKRLRTRNNSRIGMYVRQPITGRLRSLQHYKEEGYYYEDGVRKSYNPRQSEARKVWNNTIQGLGGFITMWSAYRIGEELGYRNIRMFANIHDALEFNIHVDALDKLPRMGEIMTDWPVIIPGLTVDIQGSADGTWQGMQSIRDMDQWITTKGNEGY